MSYVAKVFTVIYDLPLPVAPHVTVVRVGCDTNRSPAIRLLVSQRQARRTALDPTTTCCLNLACPVRGADGLL